MLNKLLVEKRYFLIKLNISHASYASLPQSKFFNIDLKFRKILPGCFYSVETQSNYEQFTLWFQFTMNNKAKILTYTHLFCWVTSMKQKPVRVNNRTCPSGE